MRTASSAVRPGSTRRRTSLERLRNHLVSGPGVAGIIPSGFERQATSLRVWPTCVPAVPGQAPISWTSDGQKPAAMRPVNPGETGIAQKGGSGVAAATYKEFSCRKNWLSPRPPTNGGSRFSKKGS